MLVLVYPPIIQRVVTSHLTSHLLSQLGYISVDIDTNIETRSVSSLLQVTTESSDSVMVSSCSRSAESWVVSNDCDHLPDQIAKAMSSGGREGHGLKNVFRKFQSILINSHGKQIQGTVRNDEAELGREEQKRIMREFIRKLSPGEVNRIQYIKDFEDLVRSYQMDDLLSLWYSVEDLVQPDSPKETSEVVLQFLCAFVQGQYHQLGSLRICKFTTSQHSKSPELT